MGGMGFLVTVGAVGGETVQFGVSGQRIVRTALTIQLKADMRGDLAEHIEPALAAEILEEVAYAQAHTDQLLELLHPGPSGEGIVDNPPDASLQEFTIGKLGAVARGFRGSESRFKRSIETTIDSIM